MQNSCNSISIVIATYNGSHYLREQLDSIAAQSLQPFEIIIQDDCSSDETVSIIQEYLSHLPIKLEINPQNIGYIHNFELALSKASGEFIALCDQDDIWEANKLEQLHSHIGKNSLIYSNSLLIGSSGKSLNRTLSEKLRNHFISTNTPLSFVYDNCVSAHALMFRQSLLPQLFPFPHHLYFDAWIAANTASVDGVKYLDQPLVKYRQHATNTLSQTTKVKSSLFKKIASKAEKKSLEQLNSIKIISDLLQITTLQNSERDILERLKKGHSSFETSWFSFTFFVLLLKYRNILFAITSRNPFILSFKKAIGLKLYRFFPFL